MPKPRPKPDTASSVGGLGVERSPCAWATQKRVVVNAGRQGEESTATVQDDQVLRERTLRLQHWWTSFVPGEEGGGVWESQGRRW